MNKHETMLRGPETQNAQSPKQTDTKSQDQGNVQIQTGIRAGFPIMK